MKDLCSECQTGRNPNTLCKYVPSRHGPDFHRFHRPRSQITIDSPDFHLRRSQNCLLGSMNGCIKIGTHPVTSNFKPAFQNPETASSIQLQNVWCTYPSMNHAIFKSHKHFLKMVLSIYATKLVHVFHTAAI